MKLSRLCVLLWFACVLSLSACSLSYRLQRQGVTAQAQHTPKPVRIEAAKEKTPEKRNVRKEEMPTAPELMPVMVTTENGEQILTMELEEVVIIAPSRTLPERMGSVSVDFMVTLPQELQGTCRSIVITPVLHRDRERVPLQEITIRGAFFDRVQQRDYWQYARYLQVFHPDSLRAQRAFHRFVRFPMPQGVRMDSVGQHNKTLSFHYTEQVPTRSVGKSLRITLEGRVVGLDGSAYELPVSDTLTYHISSLINFLDPEPRYVTRTIYKYAEVSERNTLAFLSGDTRLLDTLKTNGVQLALIGGLMEDILQKREFTIDSIVLKASASPEGPVHRNFTLSRERAEALRDYLIRQFPDAALDRLLVLKPVGEDWEHLMRLIREDDKVRFRREIIRLIETMRDSDTREKVIARNYPGDYAYIRKKLYPLLRAVDFHYYLHRTHMTEEKVITTEPDTLYNRGRELLTQRRYHEAYRILQPYADRNTAICLLSLGRDGEALDVLRQLPDNTAAVWYLRSIVYARRGQRHEALDCFDKACTLDENMEYRAALDPELNQLLKNRKQ